MKKILLKFVLRIFIVATQSVKTGNQEKSGKTKKNEKVRKSQEKIFKIFDFVSLNIQNRLYLKTLELVKN